MNTMNDRREVPEEVSYHTMLGNIARAVDIDDKLLEPAYREAKKFREALVTMINHQIKIRVIAGTDSTELVKFRQLLTKDEMKIL